METFLRCAWIVIGLISLGTPPNANAQSPAPAALPNLDLRSNGSVFALATDPDEGVIVGGNFTYFAGQPRHHVARLFLTGTLDANWHPDVNGIVTSVASDASGNIYLGGDFSEVDGVPRTRLARIGFDGVLDPTWNPGADDRVNALVVNAGALFAGGLFNTIGGVSRRFLAKLSVNGSGTVDANWDPSPSSTVYALTMDGADKLFVGGQFAVIGSSNRALVARISTTGAGAVDSFFAPACCNAVYALSVVGNDVFIGGDFIAVAATQRSNLAKLAKTTGVPDANWNPGSDGAVTTLLWDGANRLYAGGTFTQIGGVARQNLARLAVTGNGAVDNTWNPTPDGGVRAFAPEAGGGLLIGGEFRATSNSTRFGFAKLNADGSAGSAADAERLGVVSDIALESDGGGIVAGSFLRANGQARGNLLRIMSNGNLDPTWAPQTNQAVRTVAVDASGAIYAGGDFTSVSGVARGGLVKLARTGVGAPDANWNPGNSDGLVLALAAADSALFVAGSFTAIGSTARRGLAKLSLGGAGAVDATWIPAPNDTVEVILPGPNSQLYIAGPFASVGGASISRLGRVSTLGNGSVDPGWNPTPNAQVNAMSLRDDWFYVGGSFTGIGTAPFSRIARIAIAGNGAADASWNPVSLFDVTAILASNDGVYIGGAFDAISGVANHLHLARLDTANNGAVDPNWTPSVDGIPNVIVERGSEIEIGGTFNTVSNQPRVGLARLAKDSIFNDQFE